MSKLTKLLMTGALSAMLAVPLSASTTPKAQAAPLPNALIQEDFSTGAEGWSLSNAKVADGALQLMSNNGAKKTVATALLDKAAYTKTYEFRADVETKEKGSGVTQLLFNYQDADNTYLVELGGADPNAVNLKKRVNGGETVLAAYAAGYSIYKKKVSFEITWQDNGSIRVRALEGDKETTLFDQVRDKTLTGGKVGAASVSAKSSLDNVSAQPVRDPFLWPFSAKSIWNTPIGSNAQYVPAGLQDEWFFSGDEEYIMKQDKAEPIRNIYGAPNWLDRDSNRDYPQGTVPFPDDFLVADAQLDPYYTPNNCTAIILPDGRTIVQLEPLTRTEKGGDVFGWRTPDVDIYGDGIIGSHYGPLLSTIGGSIRKGELISDEPIRHALKLMIWEHKYEYYDPSSPTPGFKWPASRNDAGAEFDHPVGTNPDLLYGALFALPPDLTPESLGITSPAGKKIFKALQEYGAYDSDNTGWNAYAMGVEKGVYEEFEQHYGYPFVGHIWGGQTPFFNDMMTMIKALHIVRNNDKDHVGGGGIPRAPLAPKFMGTPKLDTASPVWPAGKSVKVTDVTAHTIKLSWPAASDNVKVSGYKIYTASGRWADHNWGDTEIELRQIVTSALKPNTTYTFYVKAYDLAGNESEASEPVTITTLPEP